MKRLSKLLALAILPLLALTGCNNDDPTPTPTIFSVFATLDPTGDNSSVFSVQEKDDSPVITLTSDRKVDTEILPIGNRCIISYANASEKPFVSGAITLYGIQLVANGKVENATEAEIQQLTADPITVRSIGRTGSYINLQCSAPVSLEPKQFGLYVDKASLDTESAKVYVGFRSDAPGTLDDKQFFGSFSIASLLQNPALKQIIIHYQNNGAKTFVIEKGPLTIQPAE